MKIFASCITKNEVDIIEDTLRAASQWADRIFVLDNGSTDGTWEKVQSMANHIIVPWKSDDCPFQEASRARPFNAFRQEASAGDWWCRLDSDEFFVDDPRQFLASIPAYQHVVWGIAIEYYLTASDLEQIDFTAPCREVLPRIRHYRAENSEHRFFRYRPGLVWHEEHSWPIHMGIPAEKRILYKHYKYRSPEQIQKRLTTRHQSVLRGYADRLQNQSSDWKDKLQDPAALDVDAGDGTFRLRHDKLPHHLDPFHRACVKRIMHGLGIWP